MRRIGCVHEVLCMATETIRRRALVFPTDVAGEAIQRRVRARQGVPGELEMIELRAQPAIHRMASLARCREIQRRVAWICGFLKISQMA